ncbi:MAG: carboxypeptidase regulatory-like domain-containing protein [Planctomycetes bacterium]|nr:carboxypeptidase regulatory-like domain-containing protein [Planctomycetota bacterium]
MAGSSQFARWFPALLCALLLWAGWRASVESTALPGSPIERAAAAERVRESERAAARREASARGSDRAAEAATAAAAAAARRHSYCPTFHRAPPAEPGAIVGVVVDPFGWPIAGATVRISATQVDAAPDGTFRIAPADTRAAFTLEARAPGHAASRRVGVHLGDALRIPLAPLYELRGTVRESEGPTIAGAVVELELPPEFGQGGRTVTDRDGRFTFPAFPYLADFHLRRVSWDEPELPIRWRVAAEGFRPRTAEPSGMRRNGDGTVEVTLELARGLVVRGVVRDSVTREPVANAQVFHLIGAPYARQVDLVRSDADGRFEVRTGGLPPRERGHLLGALVDGRVLSFRELSGSADVVHGGVIERELLVEPGVRFTGQLLGPNGEPIAGARVVPQADRERFDRLRAAGLELGTRDGRSDAEGRFDIGPFDAGESHWIAAELDEGPRGRHFTGSQQRLAGAAGDLPPTPIRMREEPRAWLAIVDPRGRPIEGVNRTQWNEPFDREGRGALPIGGVDRLPIEVKFSAPGFATRFATVALTGSPELPVVIELVPERRVDGRVQRAPSKPDAIGYANGEIVAYATAAERDRAADEIERARREEPNRSTHDRRGPGVVATVLPGRDGGFELRGLGLARLYLLFDSSRDATVHRLDVEVERGFVEWLLPPEAALRH